MELSDIFTNGSVVNLSTSIWRARTKIVPQDLEIPDSADVRRVLSLGVHRLAPTEAFEPILAAEREARKVLESNSLAFRMIQGARYVPNDRLPGVFAQLKEKREKFDGAVSDFCASYQEIRTAQEASIRAGLTDVLRDPTVPDEVWQAKVDRVWQRIDAAYPSGRELIGKFSMGWSVFLLRSVNPELQKVLGEETAPVKSILQGMVEGLRSEVEEKLGDVMALIMRGGKYTAKTTNSALAVIERVEALNIINDSTLNEQCRRIRELLKKMQGDDISQDTKDRVIEGLSEVKGILSTDMETAIAEAERSLTSFGQRRLIADAA